MQNISLPAEQFAFHRCALDMMSSSSCSQLGIISKNNPPPRTKLAVQHAYEFALQGLQSLVKTNFKCSKCSQTLHDTHLVSAGSCVHRYCGTCVNIHERRERARSRYEGDDSSHMPSLKKDPSFDQVVSKLKLRGCMKSFATL